MGQTCIYYDDEQICIAIPPRLYETVNSFPYVDICDERHNRALLERLLLRSECAMYKFQKAGNRSFSWEQFLALLPRSENIKKAVKDAVLRAIDDFDYSRLKLVTDMEKSSAEVGTHAEDRRAYQIYGNIVGESVVHYIALLVEREQYRRLCAANGEYSWIQHTRELVKGGETADAARCALEEAVEALDFSPYFGK